MFGSVGLRHFLYASSTIPLLAIASPAQARAVRFDVPAQSAEAGIPELARQADIQILVSQAATRGRSIKAVRGRMTIEEALRRALLGTGLRITSSDGRTFTLGLGETVAATDGDSIQSAGAEGALTGSTPAQAEILVTGSRIRGKEPAGASVTRIDRKAIEQSGYVTTQQMIAAIPQNFGGGATEISYTTTRNNATANNTYGSGINLRGLGASSTLVLLNGERPPMAGFTGVFTDLSLVPLSIVERIEILPDGASALYGSDAVAGVVNIIPRLAFRGLETSANFGFADGFRQAQLSAIAGVGWRGGHAVIAYEYYHRGALAASARPYFSEDLRRYGLGDFRSVPGPVPVVTAGGQSFVVPAGQNGTALTPADLVRGTGEKGDAWAGGNALPSQGRHAVFAAVTLDLAEHLSFVAQGLFGSRDFDTKDRGSTTSVTVPTTNPFYVDPIGTRQPVQVAYNFLKELGPLGARGTAQAFGGTAGLHWTPGAWDIGLNATFGRQKEQTEVYNYINRARLAAALADTNRATALNVFGNGTANNPSTLDSIRGHYFTGGTYRMWSTALRADGPLLRLPAGDLRLALGTEFRRESYATPDQITDISALTPTVSPGSRVGRRRVAAGYAELAIPLSAEDGSGLGIGRLDISAAARGEHYSDVGDTLNPKVGISWLPVPSVRLRATYGTSFHAPSFSDTRQGLGAVQYFAYPLSDPASPTGTTTALILSGNSPNIGPERATSWTAGVDFRPGRPSGLTAQITYFDIRYRDRIVNPATALAVFLIDRAQYQSIINDHPTRSEIDAYFASPLYYNYFNIPASQVSIIIDSSKQNLTSQHQHGVDFDLGYKFDAAGGVAELGASGSYLIGYSQKLTATSPVIKLVGVIGNPPDLRMRGRALFNGDLGGVAVFANYLNGYSNNSSGTKMKVGSWLTFDAQLSHAVRSGPLSGFRIAVNATNLFNADPPITIAKSSFTTLGIDLENASPAGRILSLQVSKQW